MDMLIKFLARKKTEVTGTITFGVNVILHLPLQSANVIAGMIA
jgi:hypothetical protein